MQITVCVYNNVCFANTSSFTMQLFLPDQAACSAANTAAVIFTQKSSGSACQYYLTDLAEPLLIIHMVYCLI